LAADFGVRSVILRDVVGIPAPLAFADLARIAVIIGIINFGTVTGEAPSAPLGRGSRWPKRNYHDIFHLTPPIPYLSFITPFIFCQLSGIIKIEVLNSKF